MNTFVIGDTHFGHTNICKFLNFDGSKVRPWDDVNEMDEAMVKNWNDTVRACDKVYHLGDVAMAKKNLVILSRLNGKKVLIKGNHDIYELKDYVKYFKDVRGTHKFSNFILSHMPIHPDSLTNKWCEGNIHGHMHGRVVMIGDKEDYRYFNASVERINYTPIAMEEVFKRMRANK
jgi:calcineurin-like phosphoesterase family protein